MVGMYGICFFENSWCGDEHDEGSNEINHTDIQGIQVKCYS
jgi:hypothetical protein